MTGMGEGGNKKEDVVVVVATSEEWQFPILSFSKGRSACQRSYADPPFEAPLSGTIVTHYQPKHGMS